MKIQEVMMKQLGCVTRDQVTEDYADHRTLHYHPPQSRSHEGIVVVA